jgi:hypothetical protein
MKIAAMVLSMGLFVGGVSNGSAPTTTELDRQA